MKTIAERLLALPSCEDPNEILNATITGAHEIQRLTAREYLRRRADQRAIEAWHKAHPEKAHMPPNHEDTVMWLMEQHDQFETRLKNAHHDWLAELNHDPDALQAKNARLRETLGLTVTLFKQIMDAIEADPVETVLIARRDGAEVQRITVQECFDKTRALLGEKE